MKFKPTKAMQNNAKKGRDLAVERGIFHKCMHEVGRYRRHQLINRKMMDFEDIYIMKLWFARHKAFKNKKSGKQCGYVNWLMWGGDDAKRFVDRIWKKYEDEIKDYHSRLKDSGRDRSRYKPFSSSSN